MHANTWFMEVGSIINRSLTELQETLNSEIASETRKELPNSRKLFTKSTISDDPKRII